MQEWLKRSPSRALRVQPILTQDDELCIGLVVSLEVLG